MSTSSGLPVPNPTISYWHTTYPDPALPPHFRSTPNLPQEATVVIVGSGITGVFAARKLLKDNASKVDGFRVVVLEARDLCGGATGRVGNALSSDIFSHVFSVSSPLLSPLLQARVLCS
jgi:heterodisulfide reductase subunit A-like polyferredoxin